MRELKFKDGDVIGNLKIISMIGYGKNQDLWDF